MTRENYDQATKIYEEIEMLELRQEQMVERLKKICVYQVDEVHQAWLIRLTEEYFTGLIEEQKRKAAAL